MLATLSNLALQCVATQGRAVQKDKSWCQTQWQYSLIALALSLSQMVSLEGNARMAISLSLLVWWTVSEIVMKAIHVWFTGNTCMTSPTNVVQEVSVRRPGVTMAQYSCIEIN